MLNDNMTLARLMVYDQSIEESKLKRMSRNLKRSCFSNKDLTRIKKRDQGQEEAKSAKVKLEKGGGSPKFQAYMCHLLKEALWLVSKWYREFLWLF